MHIYYINTGSKATEQFYPPTNDDKPLTLRDFVVVRLTTESTEDLESIALRLTKSHAECEFRFRHFVILLLISLN